MKSPMGLQSGFLRRMFALLFVKLITRFCEINNSIQFVVVLYERERERERYNLSFNLKVESLRERERVAK